MTLVRKVVVDPVQEAAERLHGRLRNAYLEAVAALQASVGLQELADALGRGDYDAAVRILGVDSNFARVLEGSGVESSFRQAVQEAYRAGAVAAHRSLPQDISLQLSFDLLNPRAVDFIRGYSFGLIQDISHDARESIRSVLLRAFQEGGHPFQQARQIRNSIGLTTRQERAVANYRNALQNNSMVALQRQLRDRRFDPSVSGAIGAGAPLPQSHVDKLVDRYRERYLKYRAETIARTETVRAANHGRREVWRQAEEQKLLEPRTTERVWIASGDADTCPDCAALDGSTVDLDDEFDEGDPPIHPNCRCTTALQFDVEKRDRVVRVIKGDPRHGHWEIHRRIWIWKYSEDEPRDPHGRWTEGGGGGAAGEKPKEVYHGTLGTLAAKIKQEGLLAPPQLLGEKSWVFTTRDKNNALEYGKSIAEEKGQQHIALVVVDLAKSGLHQHARYPDDYYLRRKGVKPEAIKRVEIYSVSDLSKPVDVIKAEGEIYLVLVEPSTTKFLKYSSEQPRVPAGQTGGGEFAGPGAGGTATTRKPKGSLDQKGPKLSESTPDRSAQNQALERAGISLGAEVSEKEIEDRFGMDVVTLKNTLLANVPTSGWPVAHMRVSCPVVNAGVTDKSIVKLTFTGPTIDSGRMWNAVRIFYFRDGVVDHHFFEIDPKFQHSGIAKQFLANSVDLYDHLGLKSILTVANIDRGAYAWVKYGFVPSQDSWDEHRREWRYQSNPAIAPPGRSLGEAAREALKGTDPRGIRIVAADPDGKEFLSGQNWEGALNLDDPESYGIFRAYVGR